MAVWVAIALQAGAPLTFVAVPRCEDRTPADEVVVCGERDAPYRLPLSREREAAPAAVRSDLGSGTAALTPAGRCGPFAGERRCGKREAADHGYGRGRDPVRLLMRVASELADPDGS